jgi:hypothetical protein
LSLFAEISDASRSFWYAFKNSMHVKIRYGIVMIPLRLKKPRKLFWYLKFPVYVSNRFL